MRERVRRAGMARNPASFIFRDEFTDDRAAGAINGTLSTDVKATRVVVDTESKLTQSGGLSVFSGGKASPSAYDPGRWWPAISRNAGIIAATKWNSGVLSGIVFPASFDINTTGSGAHVYRISSTALTIFDNGITSSTLESLEASTEYLLAIVLRNSGAFYFIKGGLFTTWRLVWVSSGETTASLLPATRTYSRASKSDFVRLAKLPAPWTDDYGIATQRLAGARSENDTFSHEADCTFEFTATTLPSVNYTMVDFRVQDSSNYWQVNCFSTGDIRLREIIDGASGVQRGYSSGAIANGQKIVVIAEGTTIKVFANNVLKITYSSASNFQTARNGLIRTLSTGGVISDLVTWPRVLPGNLQSILNRYVK